MDTRGPLKTASEGNHSAKQMSTILARKLSLYQLQEILLINLKIP